MSEIVFQNRHDSPDFINLTRRARVFPMFLDFILVHNIGFFSTIYHHGNVDSAATRLAFNWRV